MIILNTARIFDLSYIFYWMLHNNRKKITYHKNCVSIDGEILRYNHASKIFSDRFFLKNESEFSVTVSKDELLISKE